MIRVLLGVVAGIAIATVFPEEVSGISEWLREQIHTGAGFVADKTSEQNLLDNLRK